MMRMSVLTPTHNRCDLLPRLYDSLIRSTYKDFEWIILDDGSTDDTKNVVEKLAETSPFPVRYYYQDNSGKYIALNKLYDLAQSEYVFQIDDDDEIKPDAMEKALRIWDSLSAEKKAKTWSVTGRCVDEVNGNMVGKPYPDNINELSGRKLKKALKACPGEKCGCQRTEIVKQFKFPEIDGVKFIFESFLWNTVNAQYEEFYVNNIFRIYHMPDQTKDCLSNRKYDKSYKRASSDYLLHKYILQNYPHRYKFLSKEYLRSVVYSYQSSKIINKKLPELLSGLRAREKFAVILCALPATLSAKLKK